MSLSLASYRAQAINLKSKHVLLNAVLFQLCWFLAICVSWQAAMAPLGLMFVHGSLTFLSSRLLVKLLVLAALGMGIDSLFQLFGIYQFNVYSPRLVSGLVPLWLCCLWLGFALTLPASLAWLMQRPIYFVPLSMVAGPCSYAAGRALGAISFEDASLLYIAMEWLVIALAALWLLRNLVNVKPKGVEGYVS